MTHSQLQRAYLGFTLIEMLIVVATIAILSAVAMPAYNGYVNRGKIKSAQADLVALSLNFENEYRKKLSYPTSSYDQSQLAGKFDGWSPTAGDFTFSSTYAAATPFTLKAEGKSGTGVSGCTITINNSGTKTLNSSCPYENGGDWL